MDINGKRIVITGAASGIGKAITEKLLRFDVKMLAIDINPSGILKNKKIIPYKSDVSQKKNIDSIFTFALNKIGGIDIFIANAGLSYYELIDKPDWDRINHIFTTNVFSPLYTCELMKQLCKDLPYRIVI